MPIVGHSAPQSDIVDGPMHTSPCGTRHISSSGLPSSNCLMILSIAIPSGGFSLGHTSQRLVCGSSMVDLLIVPQVLLQESQILLGSQVWKYPHLLLLKVVSLCFQGEVHLHLVLYLLRCRYLLSLHKLLV